MRKIERMNMVDYPEEYFRDYDDSLQTFQTDGSILLSDIKYVWGRVDFERSQHWLLLPNGEAVAFCEVLYKPKEDVYKLVLCDSETRYSYRGLGLAREITRMVENFYENETMWTSGSFTPEGAKALGFLSVYPWETPGVKFNSMSFVKDWSNLIPIN